MNEIKTERLTIRPIRDDDWKTVQRIWLDERNSTFGRYDNPKNTDDTAVMETVGQWSRADGKAHLCFAVCLDGDMIGYVCFHSRDDGYEMGYAFLSALQGKGYARESLSELVAYVRSLGAARIGAGTALDNTPSVNLLKALGFELVHTEKMSFYEDDNGSEIFFTLGVFMLA
ncbi:MAG: GNAT family N-acetyltransferase [Ruminiclostridium sp.]|nr:GNAT family N-acetyltransferase [Ruminiclostridium sp.]